MKLKLLALSAAVSFTGALVMPFAASAEGTATEVTPANLQGWSTFSPVDNRPQSSVGFTDDFGAPTDFGHQSLKLATDDSAGKAQIMHGVPSGTALSGINAISYYTYRSSQSTGDAKQVAAFNAGVLTSPAGSFTTLVFEPTYQSNGTLQNDSWQKWDGSGDAIWWSSHDLADPNNAGQFIACNPNGANASTDACQGKLYVPLSTILAAYPNMQVLYYGLNQGTGNPGIVSGVDGVTFGSSTYDFGYDTVYPSNKDECKNNNWTKFVDTGFRSQGDCVSFTTAKAGTATYSLDSNSQDGVNIPTSQKSVYKIVVRGTWDNRSGEQVDAECTSWQNGPWKNEVNGGYSADLLDVQINKGFINWGACNATAHVYNYWVTGTGSPINLRVFDGDTGSDTPIPSWYGDNNGTLNVTVETHSKV